MTTSVELAAAWDLGYAWGTKGFYGSVPKPWRKHPSLKARWKAGQQIGLLKWEKCVPLVQGELFNAQ